MSISNEFPNQFTAGGVEYETIPGAQTTTGSFNVILRVQDSDYLDHQGVLHSPEVPEGFRRANLINWNATKEQIVEWVQSLPDTGRFYIAGSWIDV